MKPFMWNEETESLLSEKGLRCICQLCDCGKTHRHPDCRLPYPNVSVTMHRHGTAKLETDYQARFGPYAIIEPPRPIRPAERPKDLNPPLMDFRTENKMAYKHFELNEKEKPCKLQSELGNLQGNSKFDGNSVYKESYLGFQTKPVGLARPSTVYKKDAMPFHGETEYKVCFPQKEKIPQERFYEKPMESYGLLYPDNSPIPKKSLKNLIHDGSKGEAAKKSTSKESSIQLGSDGLFMTTTNNEIFKKYDSAKPASSKKPRQKVLPAKPFSGTTQNKVMFSYDENKAMSARAKICEEHPSTIKLGMDIPANFESIASTAYSWKPEHFQKTGSNLLKANTTYSTPKDKFDAKSQSQSDFIRYDVKPRIDMTRPLNARKSSAKMITESSYKLAYPNHGKFERKLYGDQHEDNLRLPPRSDKIQSTSVMQNDFQSQHVERQKSFKPDSKTYNDVGDFDDSTEYKESFIRRDVKPCTFTKFVAEAQIRRNERLNVGVA